MKITNEEIFHIFGYVKDNREDNHTPFMDYEGRAAPESVAKLNYYKKLNEVAFERRMKIKHGNLPDEKLQLSTSAKENVIFPF